LAEAVGVLGGGLRLARAQGALAWELRLASTLAEFQDSPEARAALQVVLGRVKEGYSTDDYRRAVARLGL
jgi:hypothetical protein